MHPRSVARPDKHQVPSPQLCACTHSVHPTHTTTHDIPHHAIHASTPDMQHIHLHRVYNTTRYILLRLGHNTTQHVYVHNVHHKTYILHTTCDTTKFIHMHLIYKTTHTSILDIQCHTIHVPTQSIAQWILMSRYEDYKMHIHSPTCTQHNMYDMHIIPHVH